MVGAKSSLRGRTRRASVLLAICPASVALGVGAAHAPAAAATGPTGPAPALTRVISPNWSGYLVTGRAGARVSFSSATGTWKEPSVTCARGDLGDLSTVVVGLGGYGADAQSSEDVGTDANCDAAGKPTYYAWFELVPYPAYDIPERVSPGDSITGSVTILGPATRNRVEVRVTNLTRRWTFTRRFEWIGEPENLNGLTAPATYSAEWLVEAPVSCHWFTCAQASLVKFGSVAMTRISAVGNGSTGTLADPGWKVTRLRLVPGPVLVPSFSSNSPAASGPARIETASSPAGATPGKLSSNGRAFKVKWVAVAKGLL
jgi:hypothetical protein